MAHDALPDLVARRPGASLDAEAPDSRADTTRPDPQPSPRAQPDPPAAEISPAAVGTEPQNGVASAVERWQVTLASARLPDTLIGEDIGVEILDLTHAHPSGLATLMAGRSTRLSSLVREPAAHAAARRRARSISASAERLSAERGVRSAYLAAGMVTWQPPVPDGAVEPPRRINAPVLLRSCRLHPRGPGQDDYELDLDDTAGVNPEVVRRLFVDHGIRLDASGLGGLAFGPDGFDPRPVYSVLTEMCSAVPGFAIDPRLVVGSFTSGSDALIADLDAARLALQIHPLLSRVANATPSMDRPDVVPHIASQGAGAVRTLVPGEPFCTLDPEPETDDVAFDLDGAQRAVIDAALGGSHILVEGPPGTGLTHTLAATVATLVGRGRRALVVTPHRGTADTVIRRFAEAGLADLVLDLHDGIGDRVKLLAALGADLDAAIADAHLVDRPAAAGGPEQGAAARRGQLAARAEAVAAAQVRHAAEALAGSGQALHVRREPWAVSAYQAMVALAELMSGDHPPRTRVRLPHAVCRELDAARRDGLRGDLRQVAEMGAFQQTRLDTRWLDAHVADEDEARVALAAARAARSVLPVAQEAMAELAHAAGLEASLDRSRLAAAARPAHRRPAEPRRVAAGGVRAADRRAGAGDRAERARGR